MNTKKPHEPNRPSVTAVRAGDAWSRAVPGGVCSNKRAECDGLNIEGHLFTFAEIKELVLPLGWILEKGRIRK